MKLLKIGDDYFDLDCWYKFIHTSNGSLQEYIKFKNYFIKNQEEFLRIIKYIGKQEDFKKSCITNDNYIFNPNHQFEIVEI